MRAIHKRADSRFLRCAAALMFLAACAWGGDALYARLRPTALPAAAEEAALRFTGLCLRQETPLSLPETAALAVEDGERIPAGGLLARLADGSPVYAERSAQFFSDSDGWEALSPDDAAALDADALRALLEAEPRPSAGCRGRLVYGSVWYFAAPVPAGTALPAPGACRLRFEGKNEWLPARLLALRETEDGDAILLFRLNRGGEYLSLRRCAAELYGFR